MREVKSAGVILFREEPKRSFLVLRRGRGWDLPKGHLEPGETERQGALRELAEETGVSPEKVTLDGQFRWTTNYKPRYRRFGRQRVDKTVVIFLGRLEEEVEVRPTEHPVAEWIAWDGPLPETGNGTIDGVLKKLDAHDLPYPRDL